MHFKLWDYNKVFFFDFDDNIISLIDTYVYYYEVVNNNIKLRQIDPKDFISFSTLNYNKWKIWSLEKYDDLVDKVKDWTIQEYQYYIIYELTYKDFINDELFLEHIEKTCNLGPVEFINRLWLSFPSFLESYFNKEDSLYIITARGQSSDTLDIGIKKIIEKFIEIVIENYNWKYKFKNNKVFDISNLNNYIENFWFKIANNKLSDIINYFDISKNIIPATNQKTLERFWIKQKAKPEKGKIIIRLLDDILLTSDSENWLIWFSDDIVKNIDEVEKEIKEYLEKTSKDYNKNISIYLFHVLDKEEFIKVHHY